MAAHNSGFFNAVNGDRTYSAEELGMMFDGVITDGIFKDYLFAFRPSVSNGICTIQPGRAWFNHKWVYYPNGEMLDFDIPTPSENLSRIDIIVIRIDNRLDHRVGEIDIIYGTPAPEPVPPIPTVGIDDLYEYQLCEIETDSSGVSVLTDNRGSISCPYANSIIFNNDFLTVDSFSAMEAVQKSAFFTVITDGEDPGTPVPTTGSIYGNDQAWYVIQFRCLNSLIEITAGNIVQLAFLANSTDTSISFDDIYIRTKANLYSPFTDWKIYSVNAITSLIGELENLGTGFVVTAPSGQSVAAGQTEYYTLNAFTLPGKGAYLCNLVWHFNLGSSANTGRIRVRAYYKSYNDLETEHTIFLGDVDYRSLIEGGTISLSKVINMDNSQDQVYQFYVEFSNSTNVSVNINSDIRASYLSVSYMGGGTVS